MTNLKKGLIAGITAITLTIGAFTVSFEYNEASSPEQILSCLEVITQLIDANDSNLELITETLTSR